ncbi:hypothetical protein SDC9_178542 [bioreactor metagenome]|uniref:IrrE N-terminal-like domain-containing protein n=1 Tax=bioreactor metagenome TaxID=1076179 RepID=A0A645GZA5_9ZZZZ
MSLTRSNPSQNLPVRTEKINDAISLYAYAEQQGYDVYWYSFGIGGLESVSVMELSDGKCYIGMDPYKFASAADEMCKGLHEIGHCDSGSFYNQYATCDIRQKHENHADKRAIELRLSANDLDRAVAEGYAEIWSLAEYFGVTEDFMRKAVCWYVHGNLDTKLYF